MGEEAAEASGIGRGILNLFSFLFRKTFQCAITIALVSAVAIALYSIGSFIVNACKQRKTLLDLIYWRDPKKSGIVLALSLVGLYILASFPLISVFSYLGLALLGGTFGFRVYKTVEAQLKKTDAANPFQPYLDKSVSIPQERAHQQVDVIIEHLQNVGTELKRLFLVENMCDSIKFGLLLWGLTYVGSWFSGLCLLTLLILGIFSVPKVYEVYQEPIDEKLALVKEQLKKISDIVGEKVPFLKCTKPVEKHEKST